MPTTKPSFVYVIYIASTPEKVWDALMDGEMTKQFWGFHKNVSDWKVGSEWSHQDYETGAIAVVGTVLESDRPQRLSLTWGHPGDAARGEEPTRVTFDIASFMGSVKLTVTHEGLDAASPRGRGTVEGWQAIISSLKTLLETGKPLPATAQRWSGPPKPAS